jgi:hypothetical protein
MLKARKDAFISLHKYDKQVGRLYLDLASQVNEDLKAAKGLKRIHLKAVLNDLISAANEATKGFKTMFDKALFEAGNINLRAFEKAMGPFWDAMDTKGLMLNPGKVFTRIPREAVSLLYARTYENGLHLSDSLWKLGQNTRQGLAKVVTQGLARGLHYDDPKIAEQVSRFLKPARMGQKVRPSVTRVLKEIDPKTGKHLTFTFRQRPVSYDAARLLRNEYMESFRTVDHMTAERNPACEGEEWSLSMDHPNIGCQCEDYAEHDEGLGLGVFSVGNVPMTPHVGCLCVTSQVVVDMSIFDKWVDDFMGKGKGPIAKWWGENALDMAA